MPAMQSPHAQALVADDNPKRSLSSDNRLLPAQIAAELLPVQVLRFQSRKRSTAHACKKSLCIDTVLLERLDLRFALILLPVAMSS